MKSKKLAAFIYIFGLFILSACTTKEVVEESDEKIEIVENLQVDSTGESRNEEDREDAVNEKATPEETSRVNTKVIIGDTKEVKGATFENTYPSIVNYSLESIILQTWSGELYMYNMSSGSSVEISRGGGVVAAFNDGYYDIVFVKREDTHHSVYHTTMLSPSNHDFIGQLPLDVTVTDIHLYGGQVYVSYYEGDYTNQIDNLLTQVWNYQYENETEVIHKGLSSALAFYDHNKTITYDRKSNSISRIMLDNLITEVELGDKIQNTVTKIDVNDHGEWALLEVDIRDPFNEEDTIIHTPNGKITAFQDYLSFTDMKWLDNNHLIILTATFDSLENLYLYNVRTNEWSELKTNGVHDFAIDQTSKTIYYLDGFRNLYKMETEIEKLDE